MKRSALLVSLLLCALLLSACGASPAPTAQALPPTADSAAPAEPAAQATAPVETQAAEEPPAPAPAEPGPLEYEPRLTEDWQLAYRDQLTQAQAEAAALSQEKGLTADSCYWLYDIDKDGVPELIVKFGTCEADYQARFYTFRDGATRQVGELGFGHSALSTLPGDNGVILRWGHMGYGALTRLTLVDGALQSEQLLEEDINARIQAGEDADYTHPASLFPGSVNLDYSISTARLYPLEHWQEILAWMEGGLSYGSRELRWPEDNERFFDEIIDGGGEVCAYAVDSFRSSPGPIAFDQLLKKGVVYEYMSGDAVVTERQAADLNGDGQLEYFLRFTADPTGSSSSDAMILSAQDGRVYAYLIAWMEPAAIDENGVFKVESEYYSMRMKFLFDKSECVCLYLDE